MIILSFQKYANNANLYIWKLDESGFCVEALQIGLVTSNNLDTFFGGESGSLFRKNRFMLDEKF